MLGERLGGDLEIGRLVGLLDEGGLTPIAALGDMVGYVRQNEAGVSRHGGDPICPRPSPMFAFSSRLSRSGAEQGSSIGTATFNKKAVSTFL